MVPDRLQVPGPARGPALEEPGEEQPPLGAAQEAAGARLKLEPQDSQPFPQSGEEWDCLGRGSGRKDGRGSDISCYHRDLTRLCS